MQGARHGATALGYFVVSSPNEVANSQSPNIQGLRAVAVLVVVCFHSGLTLSRGFIGVDLFFVISGFVITGVLALEWGRSGHFDSRALYLVCLDARLVLMVTHTVMLSVVVASPLARSR